jgi:hypothetical protein
VNFGVLLAGIRIFSPVWGFLPVLALRFATEKVPKPVREILPPFFRSFVMASVMESMARAMFSSSWHSRYGRSAFSRSEDPEKTRNWQSKACPMFERACRSSSAKG